MSCRLGIVASLRRKEITWPVKKCHRKRWLRRRVLTAVRKWSLSVSHLFCSVGNSRTSRLLARSAVIRRNSGLSAGNNPPFRARRSAVGQGAFRNRVLVDGDRPSQPLNCLDCCDAHSLPRWSLAAMAASISDVRSPLKSGPWPPFESLPPVPSPRANATLAAAAL